MIFPVMAPPLSAAIIVAPNDFSQKQKNKKNRPETIIKYI